MICERISPNLRIMRRIKNYPGSKPTWVNPILCHAPFFTLNPLVGLSQMKRIKKTIVIIVRILIM